MTVEEYEAMVAAGVFGKRRVQLINGLLVEKMTQNPPHTMSDILCGSALDRILPPGWHVRPAKPIRLPGQASKPEPDRCVVRGEPRAYCQDPGPGDIALVVEIADSGLYDDRKPANEVYGPAGIPVCWIVNLVDRQVEIDTDPGPAGYQSRTVFAPGQPVPVVLGGQPIAEIAVDDLLP